MTKTTSVIAGVLSLLLILSFVAFASATAADTRDARDRGTTGRTIEQPTPTPPQSTSPVTTPTPTPQTGGITNVTQGVADSGGNTGGDVTTGDEHVEVTVVNVGPTNNVPVTPEPTPTPAPAPTPEPECDRRSPNCVVQGQGRTR